MIERFRSVVVGLSLIVIVALVALYLVVQIGGGDDLFGGREGNLPETDFSTLDYDADDVGYLLCPQELCEQAVPDGTSPVFDVDAGQLRQLFADFADANPTVRTFRFNLPASQFDFTERLPGRTFPAVVTVKIVPVDTYSSTLAVYSRQPVGDSSKEDHTDRVNRWLAVILEAAGG